MVTPKKSTAMIILRGKQVSCIISGLGLMKESIIYLYQESKNGQYIDIDPQTESEEYGMNDKRMTKEEAIGNLRYAIRWNDMPKKEALEMAIKALEQESSETIHGSTYEDIAKAFQFGLAFGFGKRHDEMDNVINEIKKIITPQPKTGQWIDDKCSICGKGIEDLIDSREWYENETPNYCPFCGVRVVESEG